jgi:Ca2+-binding EF-hand superfamily protein
MEESISINILNNPELFTESLVKFFEKYDKDKNGYLDLKELQELEKDTKNEFGDFTWFSICEDFYFKDLDSDKDGKISMHELSVHLKNLLSHRGDKELMVNHDNYLKKLEFSLCKLNIEHLEDLIKDIKSGYFKCPQFGEINLEEQEEKLRYWQKELEKYN